MFNALTGDAELPLPANTTSEDDTNLEATDQCGENEDGTYGESVQLTPPLLLTHRLKMNTLNLTHATPLLKINLLLAP